MKEVTVKVGQNSCDITLQEYGNFEAIFDIVLDNNISITENLVPGSKLKISGNVQNKLVTETFKLNSPATALTTADYNMLQKSEGIGFWGIGADFKVQ